jgi:hypothetical protein
MGGGRNNQRNNDGKKNLYVKKQKPAAMGGLWGLLKLVSPCFAL